MKIGIDCRMYGLKHAGIGRYVENLVKNLLSLNDSNEYVLFANHELVGEMAKVNPSPVLGTRIQMSNVRIIETSISHYSLEEQFQFPQIINKEKVDLMHFPHFNVPVIYRGNYVVTLHDLIKHTSRGMKTTTKSPFLYWIKYLGYKLVFLKAVKRAEKIIVPSEFVKKDLSKEYQLPEDKIVVTYEGTGNEGKSPASPARQDSLARLAKRSEQKLKILEKYKIYKPFLFYVGSVYPHKNIERLIEAVKSLQTSDFKLQLVVACARNVFWERLKEKINEIKAEKIVNLVGFVPDDELSALYQEAEAFVFPTLSEGFGLPGLEAMAQKTPVICSDIPVLREIYGEAAVYFNPLDSEDMAEKIKEVINSSENKNNLVKKGEEQVKKYSWQKMAQETLQVYNSLNV